jgi:hypothetical protein
MRPSRAEKARAAEAIQALGFDAARYDCSSMDAIDWWVCLQYRSHLRAMLMVYSNIDDVTQPMLIARDPVVEAGYKHLHTATSHLRSVQRMIMLTDASNTDASKLRRPQIQALFADPLLPSLRREVRAAMAAASTTLSDIERPGTMWTSVNFPVDLRMGDDVLIESFRRWLAATRQHLAATGITPKIEPRAPLERWSTYRVLGYLDLQLIRDALEIDVTETMIGRLLFPRNSERADPDRMRKTVRELANDLMSYQALVMMGYEVQRLTHFHPPCSRPHQE